MVSLAWDAHPGEAMDRSEKQLRRAADLLKKQLSKLSFAGAMGISYVELVPAKHLSFTACVLL
jgi:hypothetical protein